MKTTFKEFIVYTSSLGSIYWTRANAAEQMSETSELNESHTIGFRIPAQPPPQALRFSQGRGERETSDWWWTARDHGKGTDDRRSRLARCLLSAFHYALFLKRDVWVRGSSQLVGGEPVGYLTIVVEDLNLRLPWTNQATVTKIRWRWFSEGRGEARYKECWYS